MFNPVVCVNRRSAKSRLGQLLSVQESSGFHDTGVGCEQGLALPVQKHSAGDGLTCLRGGVGIEHWSRRRLAHLALRMLLR
jgi:hypothetical protein